MSSAHGAFTKSERVGQMKNTYQVPGFKPDHVDIYITYNDINS